MTRQPPKTEPHTLCVCGLLTISVLFWAVLSDAWGHSAHFLTSLPGGWNRCLYACLSRLLWAAPFLILLVKDRPGGAVPPRRIFGFHVHWPSFLLVLSVSTAYVLCRMFFLHGGLWIDPNILISQEFCKYLTVGFAEELVYRGFGLNMLSARMRAPAANLVSSLFFAAVHIPAYFIHWYCDGIFSFPAMLTQALTAFLFGWIFGAVFQKSKSLWPSAFLHFWYDFSYVLLIG